MFINSGLNKLFHYISVPKYARKHDNVMDAFMEIGWLMPLVAVAEIVGGILFITNKYRALGALIIFPINIGVFLTHIVNVPSGLPIVIILMAINISVMIENREKYIPLIK